MDTAWADQPLCYAIGPLCVERCGNPGAVKVRIFTEFLGNCVCLKCHRASQGTFHSPICYKEEIASCGKIFWKTFESVYKQEGPCRSQMIWVTFPKVSALGDFIFRFLILGSFIYRSTGVVVFCASFSFHFFKSNTFKSKRLKTTCHHLKLQSMVLEAEVGVMYRDLVRIGTT